MFYIITSDISIIELIPRNPKVGQVVVSISVVVVVVVVVVVERRDHPRDLRRV